MTEIDFEAEARLDDSIQFPSPASASPTAPQNIFLTGATGFLGGYLLEEMLRRTAATVQCLVRATDAAAGEARLLKHLRNNGLWRDEFEGRIVAIPGDLSDPRFGLGESEFHDLAGSLDLIYHSAGWINMAFPYPRLKPINVEGTQEVLRLAGLETTKPVHFVSSIAVFFSEAHADSPVLYETDTPRYDPSLRGGYGKSKWVADRLVGHAGERGLPVTIHRPVRIMGHSRTGNISEMHDVLPLVLKGCLLLGKCPSWDIEVTLVPVDTISRSMVHLAGSADNFGKAFHYANPAPIRWATLMEVLRGIGYQLEEMPYDRWWQELKKATRATEPEEKAFFSSLLLSLTAPHFLFYKRPKFDDGNSRAGLAGTDIGCPPFDAALTRTYFEFWQNNGYMPKP